MKLPLFFLAGALAASGQDLSRAPSGALSSLLQAYIDHREYAGIVTVVATAGRVLDVEKVGYADIATRKPLALDDVFAIASMSKSMSNTALMMLAEEGKVSVEDPVEKYLPEFKGQKYIAVNSPGQVVLKPVSHPIRVREVMSHTAGLLYSSPMEFPLDALPLRYAVASHAMLPLQFDPGTSYLYSSAGIATAARIVEVRSGQRFEDFLEQRLFRPLGMTDTTFWPSQEELRRLPTCYEINAANDGIQPRLLTNKFTYPLSDRVHRFPVPGSGLFSTAADVLAYCRMYLAGGIWRGHHILSQASVRQMTSKQTGPAVKENYGFGWKLEPDGYSHGGAYATHMAVDTRDGLIMIFLTQYLGAHLPGDSAAVAAFDAAAKKRFAGAARAN